MIVKHGILPTAVFHIQYAVLNSGTSNRLGHGQTIGFRILGHILSIGFRDFRPGKNHRNALLSHTHNGVFGADFSS
jgi:hypothetical protein